MRATSLLASLLLLLSIISGCEKSSGDSQDETQQFTKDFFSFTYNDGKTYTATFVDAISPSKNGIFTLQYNKFGTSGSQWNFFVFINNTTEFNLDMVFPNLIVNGTTYFTDRNTDVFFSGSINNVILNVSRTTVVFEKNTYPGNIVGSFNAYTANNTLIGTGKFNFDVK
jgi:hypothetical protein